MVLKSKMFCFGLSDELEGFWVQGNQKAQIFVLATCATAVPVEFQSPCRDWKDFGRFFICRWASRCERSSLAFEALQKTESMFEDPRLARTQSLM